MTNNKFMQISSLGSADPNNQKISTGFSDYLKTAGSNAVNNPAVIQPSYFSMKDWDDSPNNPIVQGFQSLFKNPKFAESFDHPETQNLLFDVDNGVKGQAGIFRTAQEGLSSFGSDIDGKPLWAFDDLRNSKEFDLGKNRLYTTGEIVQQLGTFDNEEDSDRFAKITSLAGDPNFMGRIEGLKTQGDKKGAVNTIMTEFGYPDLDGIEGHDDPKRASGLAFAAYNYVENAEKLSPSQKSLALSTMATMSYKFKDGSDLSSRALIKDEDGKTVFSTGQAMALAGSGVDVYSLQKNWDQVDAMQRLTFGKGTASQMAATGQRMGLLGDPSMGGASVKQTDAELGQAGFTSVPSAGLGAITGDGKALPEGYEVVGAGERPGQVIAVPKGLSYSAATINGSTEIRSLNQASGVRKASTGAFKVAAGWMPTGPQPKNARGTSFASGLGQSGAMNDPYLKSAVATTSVFGNTTSNKPEINKDNVRDIRQAGENVALNYVTGGVSGQIQKVDKALLGGKLEAIRDTADKLNPINAISDKVGAKVLGKGLDFAGKATGGKSNEQSSRDAMRKFGVTNGLIDGDNWTVALSDGTTADVGTDGHGGQHEFRFKEKDPNNINRSLNAYDVDYTNDLDFTANMMTSSLVRMMAGGKGTPVDQFAGQLANASLGKGGFGQDMTEETFNSVRDNVRGFYFKQGVQTKEDAYALMNQMAGESRITEMDQIAMQQGIDMVFDEKGFDAANVLMAGRQKGLETAGDIPKSPGPNFNFDDVPKTPATITGTPDSGEAVLLTDDDITPNEEVVTQPLKFQAGTYGGNSNTNAFTNSIIKYEDENLIARGKAPRRRRA